MTPEFDAVRGSSPITHEVLTHVTKVEGGWMCTMGVWGLFVPSERCLISPQIGETLSFIKFPGLYVRAIEIGDRCYRAFTEDQIVSRNRQWWASFKRRSESVNLYMSQYHYPLTHRAIRRERARLNRERRWELQSSAALRAEIRVHTICFNLMGLRLRGFVLPESQ